MEQPLAPPVEPRRAVGQGAGVRPAEVVTEGGTTDYAEAASPAVREPRKNHVVSFPHIVHSLAHLLDDAGPLVAEDHRERDAMDALHGVEVGVAHPARGEPHLDLAEAWRIDLDLLDHERRPELIEDSRFGHVAHSFAPARDQQPNRSGSLRPG